MLALLFAGVVYHFTSTVTTAHGAQTSGGRVYADGAQYRLELPRSPGQRFDVIISRDADRTALLLDTTKQTYHDRVRPTLKTRSSIVMQFPFPGGKVIGTPAVTHEEQGHETKAGHPATKHVITVDYQLDSANEEMPLTAAVHVVQTLWVADDLPRLPFERALTTGWPEVDALLLPVTKTINGMTLSTDVNVTRTFENGLPVVESTHTEIDELKVEKVPRGLFDVPKAFKYDDKPVAP
jgi:hypothetical protein